MRVSLGLIAVLLAASWLPSAAWGQRRRARVPMKTLKASGTVKGVSQRVLRVAVEGGQEWLISVPTDPKHFVYEATATAGWLRPSMPVRLDAPVAVEKDKRRMRIKQPVEIEKPLETLTVAPLRPKVGMGIFPEQAHAQREALFADRQETARSKRRAGNLTKVPCLIVGKLMRQKQGRWTVAAGRYPVEIQLDPKAEISVQWHDVRWVRPGDQAEFSARYVPGRPGRAKGRNIAITAAEVLDAPQEGARRRRPGRSEKRKRPQSSPNRRSPAR